MAYDRKCLELAEYFLEAEAAEAAPPGTEAEEIDTEKARALAQDIQDAVEDFFEHEKGNG